MKNNKIFQKISVVIPIFNEAKTLREFIKRLDSVLKRTKIAYELIFVDDNSTDGTKDLFKRNKNKDIRFIIKKGKKGKAFSLMQGFAEATGDVLCMIDGDLQYPPEAIPGMLLALADSDVVIANRKDYRDSFLRKVLSSTFRLAFGKLLFGLPYDIQSGLKVFTKEVVDTIKFNPTSVWTFDLEFLHRARQAGFSLQNFDVVFSKRKNGESRLSFVKQTFEIGGNALFVRVKRIHPLHVLPKDMDSMLGAGIRYGKRHYITHTNMPHHVSALRTFTLAQKIILLFIVLNIILGIIISPFLTIQIVVAALSAVYFIDVIFNLYLVSKSLTFPQEITSTDEEVNGLNDRDLPVYTILCPLYRESEVVRQFLIAMENLSWPKDKLDVILLLEEDDTMTVEAIEKMNLSSYVRAIVVPHSVPKTKPKACNYGLAWAKGEYLVVYDAEDIPDPLQLKKAYLGFGKVKEDVICLQAKLNYYNPHQNLLTRFFTAEYSLWFDVTLTGLQSIETAIPLGGTSNHFKIESLREVKGWDPFNVTEDADLGVRLFKKGYKTAMVDSTTLEEANSKIGNWLRQRSRWIKGYMQTYLVHIRESSAFPKKQGVHSLIFQLVIGGKIAFILINPLLWAATFAYFALYSLVGPQIEALYPPLVFYMALTSLVFGNFLFLYYYMIGVAKKGQWNLMKFVFLIPFYWLMISVAAGIALYQLLFKPHYWEKTVHGFHLENRDQKAMAKSVVESKETIAGFAFPGNFRRRWAGIIAEAVIEIGRETGMVFTKKLREKLRFELSRKHFVGGAFIIANGVGSFFNFLYIAYLGRILRLENFALVSLIGGLYSFIFLIAGSFGTAVGYKTGYLIGKYNEESAFNFWRITRKRFLFISVFLALIWITSTPLLINFFKEQNIYPFILFSPILFISLAYTADRGFLSSKLAFGSLAILAIFEPVLKFIFSILLVQMKLGDWAYAAIPLSVLAAFILGWFFVLKGKREVIQQNVEEVNKFPRRFLIIAFLSGLSTVILLNLDVVLAKHYLPSANAGLYSLTALIGKTVFFLGSLASPFIIPLVSRNEGSNKDSKKVLNLTLIGAFILVFPAVIVLGVFGRVTAPILFGQKALASVPYLFPVTFAMLCFTLANVYTNYYLAKKYYSFSVAMLLLGALQIILISVFHSSFSSIIYVMSAVWASSLILTFTLHIFSGSLKTFENNMADFFGLFAQLKKPAPDKSNKLRVLIFNWRDTKHKWAGGAEVYVQELAKRWVKDGNSVTIFCGNGTKRPGNEIIDGVQIYRRGGFYMVYVWAVLYYMFKFRGKYDVIIDSENGIPFFTPLYTRQKKFLLIHHVHQEVFRKSLKPPFSWIALFLEAKLMPLVYKNVQVVTVSPSSKEEILKHKLTKREPIVIYNGVDLKQFFPGEKSKNPLILYVGRLQYYKSLNIFIKAAKKVLEKIPDVEFVIAGKGEEKEKLQKFAERLGIEKKIKFLGYVSNDEKIRLFQEAWVFINPSLMEGWGLTTIEANACGTPAIASDVPGLRDSIKNPHSGILVKYADYERFAENILKLIEDGKLRKEMSQESINWARQFSWEQSADRLYSVLAASINKTKKLK